MIFDHDQERTLVLPEGFFVFGKKGTVEGADFGTGSFESENT